MKSYYFFILFLMVFLSCSKDEQDVTAQGQPDLTQQNEKILTTPQYRGLYVNDFSTLLGDTSKENNLLRWCQKNSINSLSIYNMITILQNPSTNNPLLALFIKHAKQQYGIKQIAAIRGSDTGFLETMTLYNNTRNDTTERFNVLNLENEWWNNGTTCDFNCYTSDLTCMSNCATGASPKLIREEYIGWLKNPTAQEAVQCSTLIAKSDRLLIHDYRTTPDFGYMQSRLNYLGLEAKKQNKVFNVIIIFSAENTFMGNYYSVTGQNHSFDAAYAAIVTQHNAASFAGKNYIKIIGYQLYNYTFASQARP